MQHETNGNHWKTPGERLKIAWKCIIGPVIAMEMQWNLQCGVMWNQYEPQQEYVPLRGLSAICGTTCPMHFQLRLRALALRCSKAKRVSSESRSKKTTEKNLSWQVRSPLLRLVWNLCLTSFQRLFLCGLTIVACAMLSCNHHSHRVNPEPSLNSKNNQSGTTPSWSELDLPAISLTKKGKIQLLGRPSEGFTLV